MTLWVLPAIFGTVLLSSSSVRSGTHAALGSRVELHLPINPRYPGADGAQTLVDGESGDTSISRQFLGFEGPDVEITVHLPVETAIRTLAVDFLQHTSPAVFLPISVDFAISRNGTNFTTLATLLPQISEKHSAPVVERFELSGVHASARAVRVRAANGGRVPPWHRAPQALRWIFISEILVNPGDAPRSAVDLLHSYRFGETRWALTSLEKALRDGSEEERRALCDELGGLLADIDATVDARRFALQQLAVFGGEGDIQHVSAAIHVAGLGSDAVRALASIGGQSAVKALAEMVRNAEPGAPEALVALGATGAPEAAAAAQEMLEKETFRDAALAALREQGTVEAVGVLLGVLEDQDTDRVDTMVQALTECGTDLLERGEQAQGQRALEGAWKSTCSLETRLGALAGLIGSGKDELLPELLALAQHDVPRVRRAGLSLTMDTVRERGTGWLAEAFAALPVDLQAGVIRAVGGSGRASEASWLRALLPKLRGVVACSALRALGQLGDASDVSVLVAALSNGDGDVVQASSHALCRLRGPRVDAALLRVAESAESLARDRLCKVFVKRQTSGAVPLLMAWGVGSDRQERRTCWATAGKLVDAEDFGKLIDAFYHLPADSVSEARRALTAAGRMLSEAAAVEALQLAISNCPSGGHTALLLAVVGELPSPRCYPILTQALTSSEADVRAASVRSLANWPAPQAVGELLRFARSEEDDRVRILALRSGLAALRTHAAEMPATSCAQMLVSAQAMASRNEERVMVIHTAGAVRCAASAQVVLGGLAEPALRAAAETELLGLSPYGWLDAGVATREGLGRLAASGPDDCREKATELLKRLPESSVLARMDAVPWTSAFNGHDLSGWRIVKGKPDSWGVHDGVLVAHKGGGGWLAREEELCDYAIEFDFRLVSGGNSGLFLRPPLTGNPAWEGIEVQLLDDASPKYARLQADQYCAGVYGIVGAAPKVTRPAGKWQRMRVLCLGRLVNVWLNGSQVVRADLDEHMDKVEKIPGLRRASGFPGFQNEHGPIEFRGIRMKILGPVLSALQER
ncbi:MAG: DUF1080 domain-containing protein [Lentisphaerae bacterium]|jgi:HEAT repeat protein|nr:DUF1080 domain-containing protein [Lentisphaerota bacterium]MBT4822817.1 DUF1080 domain-containing protein [Lentisphaerota bacterium]MBT5611444.1 DUF1080 domain-containing protein [Lentisphaerota bacterium]MBT7059673.1 DUF1080 domain-containing protein [Lentisphaerota bacterium]MBT7846901.1 DUF1080 domain-containing protein [Lentisphaerota bacterium]